MSCGSGARFPTTVSSVAENDRARSGLPARPSPFAWLSALKRMHERWRQRQALLKLDDHLLRDIGITRAEVIQEARKGFWID
jgi:uncharacterized protein YjiS (DUF1127 family)